MAKAPKTTTAPTGQIAPFGLRMLPELKEKIEQAARESGRSMNAEIVTRLEESFAGRANLPPGLLQSFFELVRVSSKVNTAHEMSTTLLMETISALEEKSNLLLEKADGAEIKAICQRIEAYGHTAKILNELCSAAHAEKINLEDLISSTLDKAMQSTNT